MRIAIGQLWQETNTFNRNVTELQDFENWGIATGPDVLARFGSTGEIGGFLAELGRCQPTAELVGLARFVCWPWGRISKAAWQEIQQSFLKSLQEAGPVDAVLLALHGALAAEDENDVTGAILALVRKEIGPDIPLVGTLDLHANITPLMMETADVLVGYHACPHLDSHETGERAAKALQWMIETGQKPIKLQRKLPMITAAENHNSFTGPPAPLYRKLEQLEQDPRILSAGLYMAMPWFDGERLGWTVTLHGTVADPLWNQEVSDIADSCWKLRDAMSDVERLSPADVVATSLAHGGHPIVIGDGADATNSGSPGDSTVLLREFLKQQPIPHGALTFLVDPEAVAHAEQAGAGGKFDAFVGASFAPEFSEPIRFQGTVERLLDVEFILDGHLGRKFPIRMGRGAVVKSGDVTVLFTEKSGPGSSPLLYEAAGLNPRECGIVVAKSPSGFRADYDSFVKGTYLADCPGCATTNWPRLKFQHINRPLWPLHEINSPDEAEWCREES